MWFSGRHKQPAIRSLVGEGTSVTGDIRFTGGIRIDGEVRGSVIAEGGASSLVVIGEKARVHGKVKGDHVIVVGEVEGAVDAERFLELQSSATVRGAVRYQSLEMHRGASVRGELRPLLDVERAAGERSANRLPSGSTNGPAAGGLDAAAAVSEYSRSPL
jgi:cytoskeletal protein CcmA (bactofilin family)